MQIRPPADHEPLYPIHGKPYDDAMEAAIAEYTLWVNTSVRGITMYTNKEEDTDE